MKHIALILGILILISGSATAEYPPDWGYNYIVRSLRTELYRDSTYDAGWIYADSIYAEYADITTLAVPTGRDVVFTVAASNSDANEIAQADYVCSGAADDIEINAALTSLPATGGVIALLDGTYALVDPIIIPKANCTIQGQGRSTIIDGDILATAEHGIVISGFNHTLLTGFAIQTNDGGGKTSHCIFIEDGADYTIISKIIIIESDDDGIHVEGTTITGLRLFGVEVLGADGSGIYINMDAGGYLTFSMISECAIRAIVDGIEFESNETDAHQYVNVFDNIIYDPTGDGIIIENMEHSSISGNTIYAADDGIIFQGYVIESIIYGNVVGNSTDDGIVTTSNSTDLTISDNYIVDSGGMGLMVVGSDRCNITGNLITNSTEEGLTLVTAHDNAITGNTITYNDAAGTTYSGIWINRSNRNTITGNEVKLNGLHGIFIEESNFTLISGNSCNSSSTGDGINITGTAGNPSDSNTLVGNICTANGDDGIAIEGTTDANLNLVALNKVSGNSGTAFVDNGTGTMTINDAVAGTWDFGSAILEVLTLNADSVDADHGNIGILESDSVDAQHGVFDIGLTSAGYASVDSVNTQHLVIDVETTTTGSIDQTISTTVAGGETGIYAYITHITNALTGNLIGVHGNARVSTIDSPSGNVFGGYFQAGNFDVGTNLAGVRGVYVDVVNKIPSGAITWDVARGFEASMDLNQGSAGNVNTITLAEGLYVNFNLPTAGTYATVTTGYGVHIKNEAVGGTGQMLNAGFYLDDFNHNSGVRGWDFGIDFSGIGSNSGAFGTADIRGANSETIDNNTDGVWNFANSDIRIQINNFADATAVAGTADAITIDMIPDFPTLVAGIEIKFVAEAAVTGAATLNVDGTGAVAIVECSDGSALELNDIRNGQMVHCIHNGTSWVQVSQSGN